MQPTKTCQKGRRPQLPRSSADQTPTHRQPGLLSMPHPCVHVGPGLPVAQLL